MVFLAAAPVFYAFFSFHPGLDAGGFNLLANIVHLLVRPRDNLRAILKLPGNRVRRLGGGVLFLAQLVLQTRPEIHRNRPKLHLHAHVPLLVG